MFNWLHLFRRRSRAHGPSAHQGPERGCYRCGKIVPPVVKYTTNPGSIGYEVSRRLNSGCYCEHCGIWFCGECSGPINRVLHSRCFRDDFFCLECPECKREARTPAIVTDLYGDYFERFVQLNCQGCGREFTDVPENAFCEECRFPQASRSPAPAPARLIESGSLTFAEQLRVLIFSLEIVLLLGGLAGLVWQNRQTLGIQKLILRDFWKTAFRVHGMPIPKGFMDSILFLGCWVVLPASMIVAFATLVQGLRGQRGRLARNLLGATANPGAWVGAMLLLVLIPVLLWIAVRGAP